MDTALTFVNKPFCDIFKMAESDLLGKRLSDLIPDVERGEINGTMAKMGAEISSRNFIRQVQQSDGRIIWQEWTETAVFDN